MVRDNMEGLTDRSGYHREPVSEKKSASVVKGRLPDSSKMHSVERNGQNLSPLKLEEAQ